MRLQTQNAARFSHRQRIHEPSSQRAGANRLLMSTSVCLVGLVGAPVGHADPFTRGEQQFLNDVRSREQSYGDPRTSEMSDAHLVAQGWQACQYLAAKDSPQRHGINPLVGSYASLDLCHYG